MRLIKCHIENFGLLHSADIEFKKGLSSCMTGNGTGKTTLATFIEAMLYGIGDTRKTSLDENARKKYMPWQGGLYGGSLTLELGKKQYTIERSFGTKAADDTFRLIETASGRESRDYSESIGEEIFGIDRDGFLRTVYLSEKNLGGKNDNKSIAAKMSDLVGVDGDVGKIDDAIKALERRRQFYLKKNNTGEIPAIKAQIQECQASLDKMERLSGDAEEKREKLSALRKEKSRLTDLEKEQNTLLISLHGESARLSHEQEYADKMKRLSEEKARLEEEKRFFSRGVPTQAELNGARDLMNEARIIRTEAMSGAEDSEYIELSAFFSRGTSFTEIAEVESTLRAHDEKCARLTAIKTGADRRAKELTELFPMGAPDNAEIEGLKTAKGGKTRKLIPSILSILLGAAVLAIGLARSITPLAVSSIVFFAIGLFLLLKPHKCKELSAFIEKYGGDILASQNTAVEEIKENAEKYTRIKKELDSDADKLERETAELKTRILDFLGKFPNTHSSTLSDAVNCIKLSYSKYYSLSRSAESNASGKLGRLKRAEEIEKGANEFFARYPTSSRDPYNEIQHHLTAYMELSRAVKRLDSECDEYAVRYNVTGNVSSKITTDADTIRHTLDEISRALESVNEEYTILERKISEISEVTDRRDEIEAKLCALSEKLNKYIESYNTVIKTSKLLKEACDSITEKYLGKTQESFERYSELINGAAGEFAINTNFEFAKNERGAARIAESYSRGMRDLYGIAMRFALINALYDKEVPFIILDDPFIALDDERMKRAKDVLRRLAEEKQIIYFTCSESRSI